MRLYLSGALLYIPLNMRFLLYNIRYGTGDRHFLFPWSGYLSRTTENMNEIAQFIHSLDPDIIGLVEVDAGSFRSGKKNQSQVIADKLGHYNTYRSKYSKFSPLQSLPLMNKQGNAFLSRDTIKNVHFHYFDRGMKKLILELELENLTVFLVHLALTFRIRHHQLNDLYHLVKDTKKPHIVAGDFNSRWGDREINLFLAATGLTNAAHTEMPSYPSWAPKRALDFILHSPEIKTSRFFMPNVSFSDHLPLVCDFEINGSESKNNGKSNGK